ncbi:hypothetical protein C464_02270 [Halorubrum coriense DSM 10284]|uniref:Uncharacterized protein n=1 Tax=Halorubrum coriense DSM 10284 TaxID=1227466 RepID=M0ETF9_9EURY|nr:UPF0146 family protein [Halorubrum coriense]ELZ50388.1 hypothetical protein C464_02270 [Halorubrum coriense DSM 10284]
MGPPPPSERALVDALDPYERLIEVGVGRRPSVARSLADRGREVVAFDVAVSEAARDAATETRTPSGGTLRVVAADVTALATVDDGREVRRALGIGASDEVGGETPNAAGGVDAVYARNLPAELQSATVALAERLDAACLFTTLGFEEPVVGVSRRAAASGTVVYVAR